MKYKDKGSNDEGSALPMLDDEAFDDSVDETSPEAVDVAPDETLDAEPIEVVPEIPVTAVEGVVIGRRNPSLPLKN